MYEGQDYKHDFYLGKLLLLAFVARLVSRAGPAPSLKRNGQRTLVYTTCRAGMLRFLVVT